MALAEAMRTQLALHRLRPDPVDDALVLRLIDLAFKAPTGRTAPNWEFVLVKDGTLSCTAQMMVSRCPAGQRPSRLRERSG